MQMTALILVALIALLHFGFLFLEIVLWTKPFGLKVFGQTLEQAEQTAVLAANQGLYNGFLAAGLIWGLLNPVDFFGRQTMQFFLICIVIAGLYGAYSVSRRILYVQSLPALLALILLWLSTHH
jgi:putative membrane protein